MNANDLAERLDCALDAVLTVRVALGGGEAPATPEEALDAALRLHQGFQAARRDFVAALQTLQVGGVADEAIFGVEAGANAVASQAAEVGWHLACLLHQRKQ